METPHGLAHGGSLSLKTALFIDGGHLRALVRQTDRGYTPDYIEAVAHACMRKEETLLRILYYDCAPYRGNPPLPVSGRPADFQRSDEWLHVLAAKPQVAVRLGLLKFRGFIPKRTPLGVPPLTDDDFKPRFEQKGVDMRIGLDIAHYATSRSVDQIVLITGDTDCLPALKLARTAGLQVTLVRFPRQRLARELLWHSDFQRLVAWPND